MRRDRRPRGGPAEPPPKPPKGDAFARQARRWEALTLDERLRAWREAEQRRRAAPPRD